jgi:Raf kinase inhibitor-like YbhB/YbcL family protein
MSVTSTAFADGAAIPVLYSCAGSNVSPPLAWQGAPSATQAYAIVVRDPDAPGGNFTHWLIYDLPASVASLPEGVSKDVHPAVGGTQGANGTGSTGYTGPCPPPGNPHHYIFDVYALDGALGLAPGSDLAALQAAVSRHTLASGRLIGTFQR